MSKRKQEFDPAILQLTDRYPDEVIHVASSIADSITVPVMTDILLDEDLLEIYSHDSAGVGKHFSQAKEKGHDVKSPDVRLELARQAFSYLGEVRKFWHKKAS